MVDISNKLVGSICLNCFKKQNMWAPPPSKCTMMMLHPHRFGNATSRSPNKNTITVITQLGVICLHPKPPLVRMAYHWRLPRLCSINQFSNLVMCPLFPEMGFGKFQQLQAAPSFIALKRSQPPESFPLGNSQAIPDSSSRSNLVESMLYLKSYLQSASNFYLWI